MESNDMSLIEISGEDDSLLNSPNDAKTADISSLNSNNKTYFSCSPLLQLPRSNRSLRRPPPLLASPIGSMKGNEGDMYKPSFSSHKDSSSTDRPNKENVNMNKLEVPKLSLEPQQMKRKKKGGGYNLRKSLAWDRAFFTEEGVLDPSELSMLSGNADKSSREMLSVIHEGRESLSYGLDSAGDSPDLQALEDNLFKDSPASALNEGRKIAGFLSPIPGSPARDEVGSASVAKRKVLSVHDINRSASKRSGCPQPVASSSLKKPPIPTVNKTKPATKDSKVAKPLTPKLGPSVVSMTSRSSITSANHLKRSQIAKPAVNPQKNIRLKGTSINAKNAPKTYVKSGLAGKSITKSTAQNARRNVVSPVPERHSLTNVQCSRVSQANNIPEVVSDPVLPAAAHAPNGCDGSTRKIAASFSQHACHNGESMQYTQAHTAKPSGLRMPSPSLGFFGQSKLSTSHSLLQRSTQPGNLPEFSILNLCKPGALNLIHQKAPQPLGKIPSCKSAGCSVSSIVSPASHGLIKSDLELDNIQKVEVQVSHNSNDYDMISYQQQLHSICDDVDLRSLDRAELSTIKKISHMEDVGLEMNDNTLISQGGPCKQLKKDGETDIFPKSTDLTVTALDYSHLMSHPSCPVEVWGFSETDSMISNQYVVNRQYHPSIKDHSVCSYSQSVEVGNNSDEGTSKVHEDQLSSMCEVKKQSREQAELTKSYSEVDPVSYMESQRLLINTGTLFEESRSAELNKCNTLNAADATLKVQYGNASILETSYGLSHSKDVEHSKDGTEGIDKLRRKMHVEDAQLQSVDGNLLAESGKITLSPSAVDNPHFMAIDHISENPTEQAEPPSPCLLTEQAFQDDFGLDSNNSSEQSQEDNVFQSVKTFVSKRADACEGIVKNSGVPGSTSHGKQDCGFDETQKVECLDVKNALTASVDSEPVVERFKHDLELHAEASSLELERMGKGHVMDAPTIHPTEVANFCGHIGDLGGSELENAYVTTQSPLVQVNVSSGVHDMSENEGIVDKLHDSTGKNCIELSDLQSGNNTDHNERGTSIMHNDCYGGMHDVNKQCVEQATMINAPSGEANQKNEIQEAYNDLMFNDGRSFGDSQKFINGNIAGVDVTGGSGSGSPHGLCQIMEQANEFAGINNMIKKTPMEDAQVQSLDGNLLVDSCDSNISTSAENKKSSMVVDDISERLEEHPELQNPDLVIEQVPLENHGLCSGDDNLSLMNMSSVELQERDAFENVLGVRFEQCDDCSSESKNFDTCFQIPTVMQDVGWDVDTKAEHLSMDDANPGAIKVEPSVDNIECFMDYQDVKNDELGDQATLEFNFSSTTSGYQVPLTANMCNPKPLCFSSEKSALLQKTNESSQSNTLPEEAETNIPQRNNSLNSEVQHEFDNYMYLTEDKDATISLNKSVNEKKQDALVIKPPQNAVPFSDKWLAAFEAAGEEILTMKGGAVQNSPPDKSLPEPSPWSPVRKKNNQGIGPFDCTKFTNANPPSSTSD